MRETIRQIIVTCRKILGEELWTMPTEGLSKIKAVLLKDVKIIRLALDNFAKEKSGFQSIALCYFCMMAAVPFIAVAFAITNGFGLSNVLSDFLYSNFPDDQDLIDMILGAANNILASAKSGVAGLISALAFVWLIIWMMMRVEKVFNDVWHVKKSRKFITQISISFVVMLLTPFLIIIMFAGSIVYSHVLDLILPNIEGVTDHIKSFLGWVIFAAFAIFTLAAMYKFIPSAKVKFRYALKAGLLAGIAFTILQFLYLGTQVMVTRLNAVYGTIAAIPLFMLWLRYGWLIIMYGAQFSYSFQKVEEKEIEQL